MGKWCRYGFKMECQDPACAAEREELDAWTRSPLPLIVNFIRWTIFLITGLYTSYKMYYECEFAKKWQLSFQDPATPIADKIINIHHHVFFFLLVILVFVSYILYKTLTIFLSTNLDRTKVKFLDYKRLYLKKLSSINFLHNTEIEIIWTTIPSLILVFIAIPSFGLIYAMDDIMDPEITLKVIGHQWYWHYEYSDFSDMYYAEYFEMDDDTFQLVERPICRNNWNFDSYMIPEDNLEFGSLRLLEVDNAITLPIKTYIRVNITSADVLHSWTVPSLGIKIDAVPYRINAGYIFLKRTGYFHGQCSEICGVNHGFMPIVIKSVDSNSFYGHLQSINY